MNLANRITLTPSWQLPALIAAVAAIALASSVPLGDLLRFLLAILVLQVLPGVFHARRLFGAGRDPFFYAAIGIPLGIAIFILTFIACASLGLQRWFLILQSLVTLAIVALSFRVHERHDAAAAGSGSHWRWAAIALAVVGALMLAVANFPQHPLPADIMSGASYYFDLSFHMATSAQLRTHWPPVNPVGVGQALHYHIGSHIHFAALNIATGVELATLMFRLVPLYLAALLVVQLFWLGATHGTDRTGVIVGALFFLFGCAQILLGRYSLQYYSNYGFLNTIFADWFASPSFLLSEVFFCALLTIAIAALDDKARLTASLIAIVLLACGAALSKGAMVPVFCAATAAYFGWRLLYDRRFDRKPLLMALLATAVQLATGRITVPSLTLLELKIGAVLWGVPAFESLRGLLGDQPVLYVLATAPLMALAFAPMVTIGIAAGLALGRMKFIVNGMFLILIGGAGVGPVLLLNHPGSGQLYFMFAGFIALCVLAARGLELLSKRGRVAIAVIAIVGAIAMASRMQETLPGIARALHITTDREARLNADLVAALRWVRQNTPATAFMAVNRHLLTRLDGGLLPRNNDYSALAERRTVIGGYDYLQRELRDGIWMIPRYKGVELGDLDRVQMRVFREGDEKSLALLHAITGLDILFLDKREPYDTTIPQKWPRRVLFENSAALIISADPKLN